MRNPVWSGPSVVILALCLNGSVAVADDSASLVGKMDAAKAAVTSYQVDRTGPGDKSGSIVFVRGVGSMYRARSGPVNAVSYFFGTTVLLNINGAWTKLVLDPSDAAALSNSLVRHRSVELLPDRMEDGVTVGAFKTEVTATVPGFNRGSGPSGSDPSTYRFGPAVCTYDKGTFLLRMCKTDQVTMRYSRYNDPSLTIVIPGEAKDAPAIDLPPIVPRPSPSPV